MRIASVLKIAAALLFVATFGGCSSNGPEQPFFANCGDGTIVPPENCDEGPLNSDSGSCLTICMRATCGDGFVWQGVEQCDTNNLANQSCMTLGYAEGSLRCLGCRFDVSACGPLFTPTATRPPTATPTPTPTATQTPSGPTPTPRPCEPVATTQPVQIAFQPPAGSVATSVRIALGYPDRLVHLPTDASLRDRVTTTQARTSVTQVTNTNSTLGARVVGQAGTTITAGPILNVLFNRCDGAPPPIDSDFTCTIVDCQPGPTSSCTCAASVR